VPFAPSFFNADFLSSSLNRTTFLTLGVFSSDEVEENSVSERSTRTVAFSSLRGDRDRGLGSRGCGMVPAIQVKNESDTIIGVFWGAHWVIWEYVAAEVSQEDWYLDSGLRFP
jgi:hypothetical protein